MSQNHARNIGMSIIKGTHFLPHHVMLIIGTLDGVAASGTISIQTGSRVSEHACRFLSR